MGLPSETVLHDAHVNLLGLWAPWLGVAVFGIAVAVYFSAPRGALPWLMAVLLAAWLGQLAGSQLFGADVSGFFGALAMTPIALLLACLPGGPPPQVTFLPAFWLLVPGALGLIGVTEIVGNPATASIADLVAPVGSIVSIALGGARRRLAVSRARRDPRAAASLTYRRARASNSGTTRGRPRYVVNHTSVCGYPVITPDCGPVNFRLNGGYGTDNWPPGVDAQVCGGLDPEAEGDHVGDAGFHDDGVGCEPAQRTDDGRLRAGVRIPLHLAGDCVPDAAGAGRRGAGVGLVRGRLSLGERGHLAALGPARGLGASSR